MKKFKLLSTSLIVALSFASSQASYGMEDAPFEFNKLAKPLQKKILDMAIYQQAIDTGKSPGNIEATCKVFHNIIGEDTENFNQNIKLDEKESSPLKFNTRLAFLEGLKGYYKITTQEQTKVFNRIYNGKLIYTDPATKKTTELPISALKHPLKGTFDLSNCGDTGQYLSINMGYRKKMNSKNAVKGETWVAPRFLIEKELNANASHFRPIMRDWDMGLAPVGMFWNRGGWRLEMYVYDVASAVGAIEIWDDLTLYL